MLNFGLLLFNLRRKIPNLKFPGIFSGIIRMIMAAVTAYYIVSLIDFAAIFYNFEGITGKILIVAGQIIGMGIFYLIFSKILRLDETNRLLGLIFKRKQ